MKAPASRLTFRKSERLCSRKIIGDVVQKGKTLHEKPIRISWLNASLPEKVPAQAAFAVPKKLFKSAVDRNLIKRRLREAYRKNKSSLLPFIAKQNFQIALLFIYTGREISSFREIESKTVSLLNQLAETIQKNNG